mmetsp:Transcript_30914/g.87505  ORF Transcript_30914/g.87505 Transcript_30914/m.87505 type:complete len:292 (+) Transcript_30914:2058-2933(+)
MGMREKLTAQGKLQICELLDHMSQLGMLLKQMDRYAEGDKLCKRSELMQQSSMDPELREIQEYIREDRGDRSVSPRLTGSFIRNPPAIRTGRPGAIADAAADDDSPRVIQPTMSLSKGGSEPLSRASRDFHQWAMSNAHLEEALATPRPIPSGEPRQGGSPGTRQPESQAQAQTGPPLRNSCVPLRAEAVLGETRSNRSVTWGSEFSKAGASCLLMLGHPYFFLRCTDMTLLSLTIASLILRRRTHSETVRFRASAPTVQTMMSCLGLCVVSAWATMTRGTLPPPTLSQYG